MPHTYRAAAVLHVPCHDHIHACILLHLLPSGSSSPWVKIAMKMRGGNKNVQEPPAFQPHPAMGQVAGISWHVCQTYPSTSNVALVREDRVPAGPCPTTDQFQWSPSRALPLQAHLCVMESNSSSKKLEVLPPGHTPAPLGQWQLLCFPSVRLPKKSTK